MKSHNIKRDTRYFQFPLCALAFGNDPVERLNAIMHYCVLEVGQARWTGYSEADRRLWLAGCRQRHDLPNDCQLESALHQAVLAGAEALGVNLTLIDCTVKRHDELMRFVNAQEDRHGKSPLVRLRRDFVFEARDGKGLTYTELTVLAGLYSVIGRKQKPVLVTQATIRHRALGYKSPVVQRAELPRRTDGAKTLTEWQLRHTLERLHERGLFARFTFGRRLTYYSHRMKDKALRAAVVERKTRSSLFQMGRKFDDQDATDQIRNLRALAAGKPPPRPNLRGNFSEGEPFSGDAPPPLH